MFSSQPRGNHVEYPTHSQQNWEKLRERGEKSFYFPWDMFNYAHSNSTIYLYFKFNDVSPKIYSFRLRYIILQKWQTNFTLPSLCLTSSRFSGTTCTTKVSLALSPCFPIALTIKWWLPTSFFDGTPRRVEAASSQYNQRDRFCPFASCIWIVMNSIWYLFAKVKSKISRDKDRKLDSKQDSFGLLAVLP